MFFKKTKLYFENRLLDKLISVADENLAAGNFDVAIEYANRIQTIRPLNGSIALTKASALNQLGRFSEAAETMRPFLITKDGFAEAFRTYCYAKARMNDLEDLEEVSREALLYWNTDVDFILYKLHASVGLGTKLCEKEVSAIHELEEDFSESWHHLVAANVLSSEGHESNAIRIAKLGSGRFPNDEPLSEFLRLRGM